MIISIDSGKKCDKIQHSFLIKTLNKLGVEGNFLSLIIGIYKNPTVSNISTDKRKKLSP